MIMIFGENAQRNDENISESSDNRAELRQTLQRSASQPGLFRFVSAKWRLFLLARVHCDSAKVPLMLAIKRLDIVNLIV